MKVELQLTQEQFGFLIDLVKDRYQELDDQETNWAILHDTSNKKEDREGYNQQILKIKDSLESFQDIYEQLLNYTEGCS